MEVVAGARLDRLGAAAALVLIAIVLLVALGPVVWSVNPDQTQLTRKFAAASLDAPLGRDEFGRDLLARLLHGGRLSLVGALVVLSGCSGLGIVVGSLGAGLGGRTDAVLARLVDGLLALPGLLVALAIVGVLGKSFGHLLLALVVTEWPWYARMYRSLFLAESSQGYVLGARSLGAGPIYIIWRHLGPNVIGPALVVSTTNLGGAILSLTALSFLGLGVEPPQAEWGAMVNGARAYFQTQAWVIAAPGLAIALTVLSVSLLGDALRDLVDPRRWTPKPGASLGRGTAVRPPMPCQPSLTTSKWPSRSR